MSTEQIEDVPAAGASGSKADGVETNEDVEVPSSPTISKLKGEITSLFLFV